MSDWRRFLERDASGCLPGCDWPRERCACPPATWREKAIGAAIQLIVGGLAGAVAGFLLYVFILGLGALIR